jgi:hypothetical protein
MRTRKILGIVAPILMSIGVLVTIWSFSPAEQSETGTILAGDGWILYYEVSGWMNGHLSGDFIVATGEGQVTAYIMDTDAYKGYILTATVADPMYEETGSSGSFSVDLPSSSTYYIVFAHSDRITEQDVDVDIRVTGITLTMLVGGIILVVAGVALGVVAFAMKSKEQPAEQAQTVQTGEVTMFDDKPKVP